MQCHVVVFYNPCHICRPSRLPEEEAEDHFSSSLDLSEIRLNFDLEESEMQIFSEDETLTSMSLGSGSIVSRAFPRMGTAVKVRQQMVSVTVTSGSVCITYDTQVLFEVAHEKLILRIAGNYCFC
jgi:hypothetical protein